VAETITTALNATLALTTSYTATVVDQHDVGGRTATFGTGATTTYWRVCVAAVSGTPSTSAGSPVHLLVYLQTQLNAGSGGGNYWTVAINSSGFVAISYSGTGTGTITWSGTVIRNILGFTGNVSCASGGTQTATYHPTHVAYFLGTSNATNWVDDPPLCAIDTSRDGSTYGLTDTQGLRTYTFDGLFHPYDWGTRATLGMSSTASSATPIWGDSTRFKTRSATAGIVPPSGLVDFFHACRANNSVSGMAKCGALIGNFQSAVLGTVSTFDEVYLSADTLTKTNAAKPSVANWNARMNWPSIELNYSGSASF
jgi:hypothetical protein